MKYDRTVIAYHGCDSDTAERVLSGQPFKPSENDFDWLGSGIYFWEFGLDRALRFAEQQKRRGKIKRPATVGAVLFSLAIVSTSWTRSSQTSCPSRSKSSRGTTSRAGRPSPTTAATLLTRSSAA